MIFLIYPSLGKTTLNNTLYRYKNPTLDSINLNKYILKLNNEEDYFTICLPCTNRILKNNLKYIKQKINNYIVVIPEKSESMKRMLFRHNFNKNGKKRTNYKNTIKFLNKTFSSELDNIKKLCIKNNLKYIEINDTNYDLKYILEKEYTMKYRIQLDISTYCNLNCPACGMRKINYGDIKAGFLSFENFKKFVDNNKEYIRNIELSNSGEPFLNPEAPKMLKYAYENGVELTCKNGTNFNVVSDDLIHAMVDYKLKLIYVAMDGASQETYSKYRRNGNFDTVINNIKRLQAYKKEKNSEYPKIVWQYIIMKTDDDPEEIKKAISIAKDLDIELYFKLTWEKDYIPKNPEILKQLTGLEELTRTEAKDTVRYSKFHKCSCLYTNYKIVINWDGRWLGCCGNKHPSDINVFDIGIEGLLESNYYKDTIHYLEFKTDDKCTFCAVCPVLYKLEDRLDLKEYLKLKLKDKDYV